jgi:imidazolonepropionase-like amidohydrolase
MRRIAPLLTACIAFPVAAQAPENVVILADRLLDVRAGRYVDAPRIEVVGGRIAQVIPRGHDVEVLGAAVVDLRGHTLVPGLIDMHVHLDLDPSYGGYTGLEFSDRFWSVLSVVHAQRTLAAGFTTVRNVGSEHWNDVGLRQAIDEGKVQGPRLVTAAYAIGATGGHCDATYFPPSMQQRSPFTSDGPEEGRKRVREVRKYGAQVIKICATGGVFSLNTEPGQQQLSLEEMTAVVEEAKLQGLRVAAHAHGASGIRDAIRAGVTTIEHASLIDDEGIELAKRRGTWLSMDIYNTEYTQAEGKRNGVLDEVLQKDRDIGEIQRENFRRAHAAGVRMVYGTDAGIYPHGQNAKQLAVMVKYGMSPLEAIRAATLNAAEALGSGDVGVAEPGRYADFAAVTGDPLADVAVLENVAAVVKGGTLIER